jgi:hypothetical protein
MPTGIWPVGLTTKGYGEPTLANSWDDGNWHDANYAQPSGATAWLQFSYDASGYIHYYHSADGVNWIEMYQGTLLSSLNMGTPVAYGFLIHHYGFASSNGLMTIPWFFQTNFLRQLVR